MFPLKHLSKDAVAAALEKAERYRVLNEPTEAESICLDVLDVDPTHQQAIITLLLALTDQFQKSRSETYARALALLDRLKGAFEKQYYRGIIFERSAKARLSQGHPGARYSAFEEFTEAMQRFEAAIPLQPAGHDDAVLRWNTCARFLNGHPEVHREPLGEHNEPMLE